MGGVAERVFDGICHLGEGPIWNVQEQKLYWTDVYNKKIWVYDPVDNAGSLFWEGAHQVGGFAFTESGGMVLCADGGVFLIDPADMGKTDARPKLIHDIPLEPGERFNDITVDPRGRIFAGTVGGGKAVAKLFRLEKNKDPVTVLTGLSCSNGMTFSMDEKTFFHTNTGTWQISRYKYDADSGEISGPTVFFQGTEPQGYPDGHTLDSEDHIWVAFWGASVVRRFNPAGEIVDEIPVPAKQPSSVMLGGSELSELYITSACEGAVDLEKGTDAGGNFLGGPLYRYRTSIRGRPEWLAAF